MKRKTVIFALMFLIVSGIAFSVEYTVIVNKSNPEQEIQMKALKKIFMGDINSWTNGNQIKLASLNTGDVFTEFVKGILKMTTMQFSIYWKQKVFTGNGTGTDIKFFKDDRGVKEYVAATPDAVGYIATESLDETVRELKIISE